MCMFMQPTTGLDPVSRKSVWNLIQSLKRDRVIILTTHFMEEGTDDTTLADNTLTTLTT